MQGSIHGTGGLDDRRPARDLALDQVGERPRSAPLLVRQVAPQFQQPLAHDLVVERLVERVGELVQDRLRRVLGRKQGVPRGDLELGSVLPGKAERGQQALASLVKSEIERWTPIIKAAGPTN